MINFNLSNLLNKKTSNISKTDMLQEALLGPEGYLTKVGWLKSINEHMPVDKDGKPLPWYTYPFIEFINQRINSSMRIFEYGSGNSTLWWSDRVASLVACEHDEDWFKTISKKIPATVNYRHIRLQYGGEYCKLISSFTSEFDCVIIDGRDRVNCAMNAIGALKENGIIIWDNSDRKSYEEGYSFLLNNEFKRIDFWGIGPINTYSWCTSIFYRETNCLGI